MTYLYVSPDTRKFKMTINIRTSILTSFHKLPTLSYAGVYTQKQIKVYHSYMPINGSAIFSAGQLCITCFHKYLISRLSLPGAALYSRPSVYENPPPGSPEVA